VKRLGERKGFSLQRRKEESSFSEEKEAKRLLFLVLSHRAIDT
jgi:hypothetical protein